MDLTLGSTERYLTGGAATGFVLVMLMTWVLVFGLLPAYFGATPGMALVRLRVAGDDGRPASLFRHLVRTALWVLDAFPYVLPGAVGLFCIFVTPTRRRIGDLVARTIVIPADAAPTPSSL